MRERIGLEQETAMLMPATNTPAPAHETANLRRLTKQLSLLLHRATKDGKDVALTPTMADPKIYEDSSKYRIAPKLQKCLRAVVAQRKCAHIRVAIADLTKDVNCRIRCPHRLTFTSGST
jgi:hypothetical protein